VLAKVSADLQSHGFAAALAVHARKEATRRHTARIETLKKRISACDARISRFLDMASELASPEPVIRKLNELEGERQGSITQMAELEREEAAAHVFSQVTEEHGQ
jgi:hypothetical protein